MASLYTGRIYILGECVFGDDDVIAETSAEAKASLESAFWSGAEPCDRAILAVMTGEERALAAAVIARVKTTHDKARAYGHATKVRRSTRTL